MATDNNYSIVDFSVLNNFEEKENFVKFLIKRQLELATLLANVYGDSILFRNHVVLMETIANSNIPRTVAEKLNGVMSYTEFANIFISVMDEHLIINF